MRISELALKNHQFTTMIILLITLMGVASLMSMPRSEDPQFDFPMTMTTVIYPGTSPEDMEKLVVDPIEEAINQLEDLKVIRTEIEDGVTIIQTEFLFGSDPDEKFDDVVAAVAAIRDELPQDLAQLKTDKVSPADVNILQYALSSEVASYNQLKHWAEQLEHDLESISDIKRVTVHAYPNPQVLVEADLLRMGELGIPMNLISQAIQSAGFNMPGGHVNMGDRRFSVQTSGDFDDLEQIRNTVVYSANQQVIYVKDIAKVSIGHGIPTYLARYNQQPAVFVTVIQRKGTNIFRVREAAQAITDTFEQRLPTTIQLDTLFDQSISVDKRLQEFFNSLFQGLILVALFTLVFMGVRATAVVVVAIPISILMGLGWVDASGFGLQQMSIAGLVIALGLLVDNAIVVTESVNRLRAEGMGRLESAIEGTRQVGWAVISGTATTVLAFVPMLMLPTGSGTFMRSMPVTVVLTLFASLVVAIFLSPLLSSRLMPASAKQNRLPWLQRQLNCFTASAYDRCLRITIRWRWILLIAAAGALVWSISLLPQIGVSLFPKAEKPLFYVNIETPEGSSFSHTQQVVFNVERMVLSEPGVSRVVTNVGKANPRIYYNTTAKREVPNFAQLMVQTHSDHYSEIESVIETLRQKLAHVPAARITLQELMQGPPYVAPIAVRITGHDIDQLKQVAVDIEQLVRSTEGTINVDNPIARHKVDLQVNINRDKAAMLGVSISAIDQAVRSSLVGQKLGVYRDNTGDDYDIVVKAEGSLDPQVDVLANIRLQSNSGVILPLDQVAEIQLASQIPRFRHHNLQRMTHITADVGKGYQTEAITNQIVAALDQYQWPAGIHYLIGGEQENRKESFDGMIQALVSAILGILAVLVLQFRSYRQPAIIFTAIPFALIGSLIALWLTGYTFSFTAFIGLTSLVGIVVNNAIILVDTANRNLENPTRLYENESNQVTEAIIDASKTRLLPILLTTLTTIGGLLPLTLSGSSMWSPMGWAIIGGLVVSTLLTLFIVPILYVMFTHPERAAVHLAELAD